MDFKQLLNLAKANESYTQKKFKRDQDLKRKGDDSQGVDDGAVQAFLAKSKQVKATKAALLAAESAARLKRIQEKLEQKAGSKKRAAQKSNVDERWATAENTIRKKDMLNKERILEAKNVHKSEDSKAAKASKEEAGKSDKYKKLKATDTKESTLSNKTSSSSSKHSISNKTSSTSSKHSISSKTSSTSSKHSISSKNHSHCNGKQDDLKSSGSQNDVKAKQSSDAQNDDKVKKSNDLQNGVPASKSNDKTGNKKKPQKFELSFAELMKVAQIQADKPAPLRKRKRSKYNPTPDIDIDVQIQHNKEKAVIKGKEDKEKLKAKLRLNEHPSTKHIPNKKSKMDENRHKTEIKSKIDERRYKSEVKSKVDERSRKMEVKSKVEERSHKTEAKLKDRENRSIPSSSKPKTNNHSKSSSGSQLVTQTVSNRSNYAETQRRLSEDFKQKKVRNGESSRNTIGLSSKKIDNELERERLELEKQKRMFQKKLGKGTYIGDISDDDYGDYGYDSVSEDEDDDDFIDDEGENVDYSKHIRQIFGYDKRKYLGEADDDLRSMDVGYGQIQKEEARSLRIGKLEDEIEKMREEKELARQSKKMKRK